VDHRCCRENSQCATAWQLWAKQCPARVSLDPNSVKSTASARTPKQWHTWLSNATVSGKTTLMLQALGLRLDARLNRLRPHMAIGSFLAVRSISPAPRLTARRSFGIGTGSRSSRANDGPVPAPRWGAPAHHAHGLTSQKTYLSPASPILRWKILRNLTESDEIIRIIPGLSSCGVNAGPGPARIVSDPHRVGPSSFSGVNAIALRNEWS